ncbi:unnamed protein product, partial [Mesorhabditis belari]|uniref:FAM192A/Fyv6 N-terminal domain-containing protein n=1 Tax=Mesorhabditis belari TaxID=2138241 RepID=A0AAF3F6Q9_9BILA
MSSGFVSETQLDDERKARQDEWERVRKPDDPAVAPELEVCNKSLFDQLKENKDKKQAEIDEAKSFKNMIRGVDEDEADFLAMVSKKKLEEERRRKQEEKEMLATLSNTVIPASEPTLLRPPVPSTKPVENKQARLLVGAVKRKTGTDEGTASKVTKKEQETSASGESTNEESPVQKPVSSLVAYGDYSDSEDDGESN